MKENKPSVCITLAPSATFHHGSPATIARVTLDELAANREWISEGRTAFEADFSPAFTLSGPLAESLHQYNARLLNVALDHYLLKTSIRKQRRAALEEANDLVDLAGLLGREWTQAMASASEDVAFKSLVSVFPYGYGLAYVARHAHDDPGLSSFFLSALLIWGAFYSRVERT